MVKKKKNSDLKRLFYTGLLKWCHLEWCTLIICNNAFLYDSHDSKNPRVMFSVKKKSWEFYDYAKDSCSYLKNSVNMAQLQAAFLFKCVSLYTTWKISFLKTKHDWKLTWFIHLVYFSSFVGFILIVSNPKENIQRKPEHQEVAWRFSSFPAIMDWEQHAVQCGTSHSRRQQLQCSRTMLSS